VLADMRGETIIWAVVAFAITIVFILTEDYLVKLGEHRAIWAVLASGVTIAFITAIIFRIKQKAGFRFWDIIREKDFHPSLSRFQFLLWTWIVSFVFSCVVLIRVSEGVFPIPLAIPGNLMILIGISAAPAVISSGVNQSRYSKAIQRAKNDLTNFGGMKGIRKKRAKSPNLESIARGVQKKARKSAAEADLLVSNAEFAAARAKASLDAAHLASQSALFGDANAPILAREASLFAVRAAVTATQAEVVAQASKAQALIDQKNAQAAAANVPSDPNIPLGDIFNEDGKPAMTRFQMFVWTFVAIIVYLILFGMTLYELRGSLGTLTIPDIDNTLLTLMGLSQGAYVAGKMTKGA
jgi:hypothetical protein